VARFGTRAERVAYEAGRLTRRTAAAAERAGLTSRDVGWIAVGALASLALALLGWRRRPRGGRVEDVMVKDVVTIDASATLDEVARRMRDSNVGVLPVVATGRLVGVITDRDLVVRALAEGVDMTSARASDFATREMICARPESPIDEAMEVMADRQVGRLPVVDMDDRLVGIVTLSSLALRSRQRQSALETAQEVSRRSSRVA
jgi:CBS domain-containing protein